MLPEHAVYGSIWRVRRELWIARWQRLGVQLSDHALLQHGWCWLPRSDEQYCYADCAVVDDTPTKRIWRRKFSDFLEDPETEIYAANPTQPRTVRYELQGQYVRDARGIIVARSHGALPERASPHVLQSEVIEGAELLERIDHRRDGRGPIPRGRGDVAHAPALVTRARELVRAGEARVRRRPMARVEGGHLVVAVGLTPNRWAGERDGNKGRAG